MRWIFLLAALAPGCHGKPANTAYSAPNAATETDSPDGGVRIVPYLVSATDVHMEIGTESVEAKCCPCPAKGNVVNPILVQPSRSNLVLGKDPPSRKSRADRVHVIESSNGAAVIDSAAIRAVDRAWWDDDEKPKKGTR